MPNTRTAVVCDDDPLARSVIRSMVEEAGYEVVEEASNAEEVIAACREHHPTVVLLDISMPGRSGMEALPDIRVSSPNSKVVVVSSFAVPLVEASDAGAMASLDKAEIYRLFDILNELDEAS